MPQQKITFPKTRRRKTLGVSKPKKKGVTKAEVRKIADKQIDRKAEKNYLLITPGAPVAFDQANPLLTIISTTVQDNTAQGRTGNKISPTSLKFDYTIYGYADPPAAQTPSPRGDVCRVLIIQYMRDVNVSPLQAGYILENTSQVGAVHSPYAQTAKRLFNVLYDMKHTVNSHGNIVETGHIQLNKLKDIRYDNLSNLGVGEIYFLVFSEFATVTSPNRFNYIANLRFTDL